MRSAVVLWTPTKQSVTAVASLAPWSGLKWAPMHPLVHLAYLFICCSLPCLVVSRGPGWPFGNRDGCLAVRSVS